MTFVVPIVRDRCCVGTVLTLYEPGIGLLDNENRLRMLRTPCADCMLALSRDSEEPIPVFALELRSAETRLRSIAVQEVFYEGVCGRCKKTLRVVSAVTVNK